MARLKTLFLNFFNVDSPLKLAAVFILGLSLFAFSIYKISSLRMKAIDPLGNNNWVESLDAIFMIKTDSKFIKIAMALPEESMPMTCWQGRGSWRAVSFAYSGQKLLSSLPVGRPGLGTETYLGYRAFDQDHKNIVFEGKRTLIDLPMSSALPNLPKSQLLSLYIDCTKIPAGNYQLQIEAVQERIGWQSEHTTPSHYVKFPLQVLDFDQGKQFLSAYTNYQQVKRHLQELDLNLFEQQIFDEAFAKASLHVFFSRGSFAFQGQPVVGAPFRNNSYISAIQQSIIQLAYQLVSPVILDTQALSWYNFYVRKIPRINADFSATTPLVYDYDFSLQTLFEGSHSEEILKERLAWVAVALGSELINKEKNNLNLNILQTPLLTMVKRTLNWRHSGLNCLGELSPGKPCPKVLLREIKSLLNDVRDIRFQLKDEIETYIDHTYLQNRLNSLKLSEDSPPIKTMNVAYASSSNPRKANPPEIAKDYSNNFLSEANQCYLRSSNEINLNICTDEGWEFCEPLAMAKKLLPLLEKDYDDRIIEEADYERLDPLLLSAKFLLSIKHYVR